MSHPYARIALSAALSLLPVAEGIAFAQTGPDVTFELRPHCVEADHAAADDNFGGEVPHIDGVMDIAETSVAPCPEYEVRDPSSRQTGLLKVGDTLDMDLIMHNPSARPLKRFRAWIGYDSDVLEGKTIELSGAFPVATPGESDFSVADNYIKLSGTSEQAVTGTKIVLARVILTVKEAPSIGSALSFYDATGKEDAHTGAFIEEGTTTENVAPVTQGSLAIRFQPSSAASSVSSVASSAPAVVSSAPVSSAAAISSQTSVAPISSVPASSSASSVPPPPAVFSKLQVQGLRVTTEGSSVFLAWNPLPSADLTGYNLYYGTISGKYLQRRSVDKEGQTLTIRALPVGQTYYFAVRAVNGAGEESDYSQEVAVTVGNAATSTSPLSGALIDGGPNGNAPGTGGNVAGESGPASWFLLFAAVSAVTGTLLAFRRQWTAVSTLPR
jgi:hypothetical protein